MALFKKSENTFSLKVPLICRKVDFVSLDDASKKGFVVAEGTKALIFSKEGTHLDLLHPGSYGKGGLKLPSGIDTKSPVCFLLALEPPFQWKIKLDPAQCMDGIKGRLETCMVLRCTNPGRLFSRLESNDEWKLDDLEAEAAQAMASALESAARAREALELRDAGELLRSVVKQTVIDQTSLLFEDLGIELVSVKTASFSSDELDRHEAGRAEDKMARRRSRDAAKRVNARNALLHALAEQKEAGYVLEKKELDLIARAEKEKLLREEEIDALKRMREANDEEREHELARAREKLNLEHKLDLQRLKAEFAQEVRERKLSLDREHIQKLLMGDGERADKSGIAATVLCGLMHIGVPVTGGLPPRTMAALCRGELPESVLLADGASWNVEQGIPVALRLASDTPFAANKRCLLRLQIENLTDDRLHCKIDPAVTGLKFAAQDLSGSGSIGGVPGVLLKKGEKRPIDFAFIPKQAGLYRSSDIELETKSEKAAGAGIQEDIDRDAAKKRNWFKVPTGTFTLNVGEDAAKSVVVNAEVMAGDVYVGADRGGVEVSGTWIRLPIEKAPPPPGCGLPERLKTKAAGSMRFVKRARFSWYGGEGVKSRPRSCFVFGEWCIEIGRKAPLLIRDTESPNSFETNTCISRKHTSITLSRDRKSVMLQDLRSTNGTYMLEPAHKPGARTETLLPRGKSIELGGFERFRLASKKSPFSVLFECRIFRKSGRRGVAEAIRLRRSDMKNHSYVMVPSRAFIGSGKGAAIRVDTGEVPMLAAVLEWQACGFVIGPAAKEVSLLVNGEKVPFGSGIALGSGAEVRIGNLRMTFEEATDSQFKSAE